MANIVFTEGSGLNKSCYGEILFPLRKMIEDQAEPFEKNSLLNDLFSMETSEHFGESISGMTSMEGPKPVGEAGDYPTDGFQEDFISTFRHETWKDAFHISEEMVMDNNTIAIKSAPYDFLKAWHRTREIHGLRLYAEAVKGNTSFTYGGKAFSTLSADKVALFSKVHPSKTGRQGNQSNLFADAFSADALGAMESTMHGFKDANGAILDVRPDTILIPDLWPLRKAVLAAIGADKDPDTANNGANIHFGRWNVIITPYLNDLITANTAPWILLDSDRIKHGTCAVWYDRKPLTLKQTVADNDNLVHKASGRWSAGFHDWRFAAVGGVSGGTDLIPAA